MMTMQVEHAAATPDRVTVRTTGAEFVFDSATGTIDCWQRIPVKRKVAVITGIKLTGARIAGKSDVECRLAVEAGAEPIVIGMDSLLTLPAATGSSVTVTGTYAPAWTGIEMPHILLPDEQGGVGIYLLGVATCEAPARWATGWQVRYKVDEPARVLVSVFPPKPFDWQMAGETMLHSYSCTHPYPSDDELVEFRKMGSLLTLHSWIWVGDKTREYGIWNDNSWGPTRYEAKDEKELHRVLATAHRLGMKVIPYLSPYYFSEPVKSAGKETMPAYLAEVKRVVSRYGFDGVYFDGLYADILGAYEVTRRVRELIGNDGIFYIHNTFLPLNRIYCPFIDCYADYILRGENTQLNKDTARWYVSSFNLGNAVGTFCYNVDRITPAMIEQLLAINARLPVWVQDGTWDKFKYYLSEDEWKLVRGEYLPRMARVQ